MDNLKKLFENSCPHCRKELVVEDHGYYMVRYCPNGDYKEESYPHLGFTLIRHSK